MNRKEDLQYFADVLLIDKLAIINIGLSKNAGIADMAGGMVGSIVNEFKEEIEKGGGGATGVLGALGEFFLMGWVPWPLKIVMLIGKQFGFDVSSILKSIWGKLKPEVENATQKGQQLDYNKVRSIIQNEAHAAGAAPAEEDTASSDDMLYALRKFESGGMLVRTARGGRDAIFDNLAKVFSTYGAKTGKWTTFGFIWFIVKTILIGAGLLTAGSAASKYLGVGDKEQSAYTGDVKPSSQVEQNQYYIKPLPWVPPVVPNSLTETGSGQTHFTNDGISKTWSVPLKGGLKNTMMMWAGYVYKDLQGQEQLLNSTAAFNIMVSNLNNYVEGTYLSVPPNFHSIKEIVDTFAGQAARQLGKSKESEHETA